MTRRLVAIAVTITLAACAPAPKAARPAAPDSTPPAGAAIATAPTGASVAAAFRCADSTQIFALFRTDSTGRAEVALAIGDDRLHLPQLVSASGARYGDSSTTFWNKGDEADFTRGGKQVSCRVEK